MAFPITTGIYNPETNSYTAPNTGTWANVTSWSTWTTWSNRPADYYTVGTEIEDRGVLGYFNLAIETEVTGTVTYRVFTSNTGSFAGEETIVTIVPEQSNVAAFYGQYYAVEANVATNQGAAEMSSMTVSSTNRSLTVRFNQVQTSDLEQTATGARLPVGPTVGAVVNCQITCWDSGNTAPLATDTTNYYMETPIYRAVMPYITSRTSTGPTFHLRDMYLGKIRTAESGFYIDAVVEVLPLQVRSGNNLNVAYIANVPTPTIT